MEKILEYHSGQIEARLERSRVVLVQGLDLTLYSGDSLALIGETGSGKTMTALSILGLLPDNVVQTDGETRFQGTVLPPERRKLLGLELVYIPQNGMEALNPVRTVRRHMYDNLKRLGLPRRQWESAALDKLRLAGLEEPEKLLDSYPFQISGGMAQRVVVAIAACSRARLVIADEPTNGMDARGRAAFRVLLARLFPEAALLMITHDISAAALCDRVLVLCGGRPMEEGPGNQVLTDPRQPYTAALLGALAENGMQETPLLRRETGACPFYRRCPRAGAGCRDRLQLRQEGERRWWCQ